MADTRVHIEVEDWVRREWMPTGVGGVYFRERVKLDAGGLFDADAVSADHQTVATISTSSVKRSNGGHAVGSVNKIRADSLFLIMSQARRRLMVLTDPGMHAWCIKEQDSGRLPRTIEYLLAPLPATLAVKLKAAKEIASREVRPGNVIAGESGTEE